MAKKAIKGNVYTGKSASLVEKLTEKLGDNASMFGMFAFGETHFRQKYSKFHITILNAALDCVKLAIAAPRGHGKTTILSFLYAIFCIVFKKKRHIVILQSTLAKATGSLSTIKYELLNNELLKVFGIEILKDTQEEAIFKHADWFMTRVICKGYDQMGGIRGEKFIAWRPDLVLVDDLQDDKTVQNPDLRLECERIFNDAVDPAIDYHSGGQLIFIGTIIHDDCLIAKLISDNKYLEFKKYRFQARNVDDSGSYYALWSEKYSLEDLEKIEADDPIKFAKEYQNDPISGARQQFHDKDFRMWNIQQGNAVLYNEDGTVMAVYNLKDCRAAIGCDLAWSEKKEADDSVLFPGLLTPNDEVLLDYYIAKKGMRPDEFEELLFTMVEKYENMTGSICEVGFEKAMLEKVMGWMLSKAMRVRRKYLIIKQIKWDKDKITRIVTTLQPRYVNHTIFHRSSFGEYEHQLLRIPSGTHDDLCLVGSTLILTDKGNKRIDKIKIGDMVMTRNGYKPVINVMHNGFKNVINRYGLIGTSNHPIITKKGIKRLDELHMYDTIYTWNEKLSYIEEKNIIDIQSQREGHIEFTSGDMINGKNHHLPYIVKYGLIILEKFLKDILSTIRMEILSIMRFPILNVCQDQNICECIVLNQNVSLNQNKIYLLHKKKLKSGIKVQKVVSGIPNTLKELSKTIKKSLRSVNSVVKNLVQKSALKYSAIQNVKSESLLKDYVYNLTIEDNHEYFANGILVHNCDASHNLVKLLKFAKTQKKEVKEDTEIEWIMKKRRQKAADSKKDFVFGKKDKDFTFPLKTTESYK